MAKTSDTKPKLKALATTTQGKHFDLHFAMMTPFYPGHPKAFKDAAELILDAQESAKRHNDRLLFPVLYLYRHYLELQLKELVILGVKCGTFKLEEVNHKKKGELRKHDLDNLWKLVTHLSRNGVDTKCIITYHRPPCIPKQFLSSMNVLMIYHYS